MKRPIQTWSIVDEDLCFSVPANPQLLVLRGQAGGQKFRACAYPCAPPAWGQWMPAAWS